FLTFLAQTTWLAGDVVELRDARDKVVAAVPLVFSSGLRAYNLILPQKNRTGLTVVVRPAPGDSSASPVRIDDLRLAHKVRIAEADKGERQVPDGLWGFADTHTHPMANLAYGGSLVYGDPDAVWNGFDKCRHDWGGGGHVNTSQFTEQLEPA